MRLDHIRHLIAGIDPGALELAACLGVDRLFQPPLIEDEPGAYDEPQLYALAGVHRPGLVDDLLGMRLIARQGDRYWVPSPALVAMTVRLEAAGIELELAIAAAETLHKHLWRVVHELVELFTADLIARDDS